MEFKNGGKILLTNLHILHIFIPRNIYEYVCKTNSVQIGLGTFGWVRITFPGAGQRWEISFF